MSLPSTIYKIICIECFSKVYCFNSILSIRRCYFDIVSIYLFAQFYPNENDERKILLNAHDCCAGNIVNVADDHTREIIDLLNE